ncbi:hypothetical protein [Methanosarcina sp. UBA289]|uniref:hypothetical protein n=1 Tax=Methanosarcina sp. UBA289 TaxID=1915574 RepID=UPI0025E82BD1|nr:hypothetical protein [Methanosarcina sp. UBA289]
MFDRKPFQKRFDRKRNETMFGFEKLIPEPCRRDKPAQRFRPSGFDPTVKVKLPGHENVSNRPELL